MPLIVLGASIVLLLVLIARLKLNAFLALVLTSLAVGVLNGMSPDQALKSVLKGIGDTMGSLVLILVFGAILGKLIEESLIVALVCVIFLLHARSALVAIITLPLGVLQYAPGVRGAVQFRPALGEKKEALRRLASGPVLKVAMRFRSAFWEEIDHGRYRDFSFFHSPRAAFPTFWTALPARAPLLIAWAGGPKAARLTGSGKREIIREAA